jgi:hypothetical protein
MRRQTSVQGNLNLVHAPFSSTATRDYAEIE